MIDIKVRYIKTLFRNQKTGFTVFLAKPFDLAITNGNILKGIGFMPKCTEKMPLLLYGELNETPNEWNFHVEKSELYIKNKEDIELFLKHLPKCGIGTKKREEIINKFGERLITEYMNPEIKEELKKIKGISEERATLFLNKIAENLMIKKIFDFIYSYGGTYKQAEKIYKKYGNTSLNKIEKTPYACVQNEILSFGIADSIAKSQNILFYDENRVKIIVELAFDQAKEFGDCYFTYDTLKKTIRQIEAKQSAFSDWIPEAIIINEILKCKKGIIKKEQNEIRFFAKSVYYAEEQIAKELMRLKNTAEPLLSEEKIKIYNKDEKGFVADESQKKAMNILKDTIPKVLTGGPGTGKTTTIQKIIFALTKEYPQKTYALCAPTGRAAERIMESTGLHASTIHRLLECTKEENGFSKPGRNEDNPIEEDVIIVDEFSMVGIFLFKNLLKALKDGALLILVGDINQLESLEPGALLQDIIESNCFPVYRLNRIHRQSAENLIIENSKRIAEKNTNLLMNNQFVIEKYNTNEEIENRCKELALKNFTPANVHNFHILSPVKNGIYGINNLNKIAQALFHTPQEVYYIYGEQKYYINDKIMTVVNNYDIENEYFNGDLGIIDNWDNFGISLDLNDKSVYLNNDELEALSLAYALTIHKIQGSEGKNIVLVLSDDMDKRMLNNAILYTAVTRAKEKITILVKGDALEFCIINKSKKRNTTLKERIQLLMSPYN